jgi:sugar/nucleoside kinase (ribokinase family)
LGSGGCKYQDKIFPVTRVEIRDLIGAGDTFLASLVYNFVKRGNIYVAIDFANERATQVVQQRGVNTARWIQ